MSFLKTFLAFSLFMCFALPLIGEARANNCVRQLKDQEQCIQKCKKESLYKDNFRSAWTTCAHKNCGVSGDCLK